MLNFTGQVVPLLLDPLRHILDTLQGVKLAAGDRTAGSICAASAHRNGRCVGAGNCAGGLLRSKRLTLELRNEPILVRNQLVRDPLEVVDNIERTLTPQVIQRLNHS
ncbi:MAG: hypothetical protein IIX90_02675, partial [Clostridia bacterium]|nr:hypothetical protein [Clostridia bacterium]